MQHSNRTGPGPVTRLVHGLGSMAVVGLFLAVPMLALSSVGPRNSPGDAVQPRVDLASTTDLSQGPMSRTVPSEADVGEVHLKDWTFTQSSVPTPTPSTLSPPTNLQATGASRELGIALLGGQHQPSHRGEGLHR